MIVSTTPFLEGHKVTEYKGVVRGLIVRSPNIKQEFMGNLKSFIGGKIGAYAEMCETTRSEASALMMRHAEELGANAIISVRYDTSDLGANNATEVLCYGTAVVLEKEK